MEGTSENKVKLIVHTPLASGTQALAFARGKKEKTKNVIRSTKASSAQ